MAQPQKRYLRPAVIISTDVKTQTCRIKFTDYPSLDEFECPIPHPMAGPGWGIFAIPTQGTRVYVNYTSRERPRIVSTIPLNQFSSGDFSDSGSVGNVCVDEAPYPPIKKGELALQSVSGANLIMNNRGDIKFQINNSSIEYNGELDTSLESFSNIYTITEGVSNINGVVRRDIRPRPTSPEKNQDKLISLQPEFKWVDIGRNPRFEVQTFTVDSRTTDGKGQISIMRNPALIENRTLVHEYSRSDAAQNFDEEANIIDGINDDDKGNDIFFNKNRRERARTDVLNLGLHNPNSLIEKVEGTLVDIYGNILDINRNIIDFSDIKKIASGETAVRARLEAELALLRRSIKYHFEINTKKDVLSEQITPADSSGSAAPILDAPGDEDLGRISDEALRTGYSHSRFSIDIDGEGFTKINVPSSSNQGNIPFLSRYITSFDPNNRHAGDFRDPNKKDIRHIGFGKPDIDVSAKNYVPENIIEDGSVFGYGTAYHNLGSIINEIDDTVPLNGTIYNDIDNPNANAGGRSLHINLDGSMDLNVGRDVIDKKSIVLDTAGSVMSMIGRDINDNSIISQIDGNVKVQVGNSSTAGEEELSNNTVEIAIKTVLGYHKITIDASVMKFETPGNMVFDATGNIVINAGGEALMNGSSVVLYGAADENGELTSRKRSVNPNGEGIK